MVYGAEAVLPHDLKFGAPRISGHEEEEAEEAHQDDKDIVDEARDIALARSKDTKTNCAPIRAADSAHESSTWGTSSCD